MTFQPLPQTYPPSLTNTTFWHNMGGGRPRLQRYLKQLLQAGQGLSQTRTVPDWVKIAGFPTLKMLASYGLHFAASHPTSRFGKWITLPLPVIVEMPYCWEQPGSLDVPICRLDCLKAHFSSAADLLIHINPRGCDHKTFNYFTGTPRVLVVDETGYLPLMASQWLLPSDGKT